MKILKRDVTLLKTTRQTEITLVQGNNSKISGNYMKKLAKRHLQNKSDKSDGKISKRQHLRNLLGKALQTKSEAP